MKYLAVALAVLCLPLAGRAEMPASDLSGSQDSPLVKRYEGSVIVGFHQKEFDDYSLALGPRIRKDGKFAFDKQEDLEGKITRISYFVPAGRSALEVFRNYEAELKASGFDIMFSGRKDALGENFSNVYENSDLFGQLFYYSPDESSYLAAKKDTPDGVVHVGLFVTEFQYGANTPQPDKGQAIVQLDVVESKPMEQKMVTVSAGEMSQAITDTGRVALYDILFDFNKADLQPASQAALEQIAKLLNDAPALKLLVVGHTDNEGGYDFNLDLSMRRAQAVVQWLTAKGIAATRLRPAGAGFLAPVASNHTEEGRAKNRRVELVEQ